jgi:hypothetical protein
MSGLGVEPKADRFWFALVPPKRSPFRGVCAVRTKKPDRYWSAPRRAKRLAISREKIDCVRSSEFSGADSRCWADYATSSPAARYTAAKRLVWAGVIRDVTVHNTARDRRVYLDQSQDIAALTTTPLWRGLAFGTLPFGLKLGRVSHARRVANSWHVRSDWHHRSLQC